MFPMFYCEENVALLDFPVKAFCVYLHGIPDFLELGLYMTYSNIK